MARPPEYSEEKLALAQAYLDGGWMTEGDKVPQIAGLAIAMGIDRTTAYDWAADEGKAEFSYIFEKVKSLQERNLVNGGLGGDFNPAITKMMLTKHGYSDASKLEHSGPNGGPIQSTTVDPSKLSTATLKEIMAARASAEADE